MFDEGDRIPPAQLFPIVRNELVDLDEHGSVGSHQKLLKNSVIMTKNITLLIVTNELCILFGRRKI